MIGHAATNPNAEIQALNGLDSNSILLNESNGYDKNITFSGKPSDGNITDYEWNLAGSSQNEKASVATFKFERSLSSPAKIGLTVSGSSGTDYTEKKFRIEDTPEIDIGSDQTELDGAGTAKFSVKNVNNSFDKPLAYEWSVEGKNDEKDDKDDEFNYSFSESDEGQDFDITVLGTDDAGNSQTDTVTLEVKNPRYEISIISNNAPIIEGLALNLEVKVESLDGFNEEDKLILEVDGDQKDSVNVNVAADSSNTYVLKWQTDPDDSGTYEAKVSLDSGDSSISKFFEVQTPPEPDDTGGGGGDGGGGSTGPAEPKNESDTLNQTQNSNQNTSSSQDQEGNVFRNFEQNYVEVAKNVTQAGDSLELKIDPEAEQTMVESINLSTSESGQISASVREIDPNELGGIPRMSAQASDVYRYQRVNATVNESDASLTQIDFRVEKSWLEARNVSAETVEMRRYDDGSWAVLNTQFVNSSQNFHRFEVQSQHPPSFYGIAIDNPTQQVQNESYNQNKTNETSLKQKNLPVVPGLIIIFLLLTLPLTGYIYNKNVSNSSENVDPRKDELMDEISRVRNTLSGKQLDEKKRQEVMLRIQRAISHIDNEDYEQAEDILSTAREMIE